MEDDIIITDEGDILVTREFAEDHGLTDCLKDGKYDEKGNKVLFT